MKAFSIRSGVAMAALALCALAVAPPAAHAVQADGKTDKAVPAAAQPAQPPLLPGGASALSETHGDWNVNCQVAGATKACGLSHQQFDKTNNQRLLAIQLASRTGEDAAGTIALPFGLALSKGIGLEVDDKPVAVGLQFSTCLIVGCLVPVAIDARLLTAFKAGNMLKLTAVAADTGQPVDFSVSLNGFASALARTAELSAN